MSSLRTPREVHCVSCNHVYNWMYNEACPQCKTDVELTLDEYYTQLRIIQKQYEEHAVIEDDEPDQYSFDSGLYTLSERLGMDGHSDAELADEL